MRTSSSGRPRASRASRRAGRRRSRSSCRSGSRQPRGARPSPGGPAKHWAMSSHRSASGPAATSAVSARWMRWVTSRQKSYAGPVTVCGGVLRAPRPDVARRRGQGRRGTPRPAARLAARGEGEAAGADAEVRDVLDPVADLGLDAERRVDVERVGPGLHEPRGRHRGRPTSAGRTTASAARRGTRAAPRRGAPGRRASGRAARPGGDRAAGERRGVDRVLGVGQRLQHQRVPGLLVGGRGEAAASSVQARWATWVATSQPSAGVGRPPAGLVEAGHQALQPVALGGEVGEHALQHVVHAGRAPGRG